jgi:hypothetical protein
MRHITSFAPIKADFCEEGRAHMTQLSFNFASGEVKTILQRFLGFYFFPCLFLERRIR